MSSKLVFGGQDWEAKDKVAEIFRGIKAYHPDSRLLRSGVVEFGESYYMVVKMSEEGVDDIVDSKGADFLPQTYTYRKDKSGNLLIIFPHRH